MARPSTKQKEPEQIKEFKWSDYRNDEEISVNPWGINNNPETKRSESAGYNCPNSKCEKGKLVWLNKVSLSFSEYGLLCHSCYAAFKMPHKIIWTQIQKQFKEQGVDLNEPPPNEVEERTLEVSEEAEQKLQEARPQPKRRGRPPKKK